MLHSLYGSMDSSKSCETTASKPRPAAAAAAGVAANGSSPTASVSESNAFASEHEQWNQAMAPGSTLQGFRFDLDIDVEVQSPDRSIWEALFADQVNPAADAGEYMMSSPKKMSNSMSCSYVHGLHGGNGLVGYGQHELNSQIGPMKGKAQQSPLHKVFSGSATRYVQGETDLFLDDFVGEYASGGAGGPPEAFDVSLISAMPEAAEGELYQVDQFASELQAQAEHGNLLEPSFHGFMEPEQEQEQDSGLQLVHLLLACAEAVAKDDYLSARRYLHHLNRVVSPLGDSMQRVASCFTDALAARLAATLSTTTTMISKASPSPPPPPPNSYDILKIYQILYQACPYIKFAHFTANQAIFEAFHAEARVHVIDLDILQGYQWPAFIQALAARPAGPPFLRITGVGPSLDRVRETGRHLAELAHSLRVPFEFHPVGERPEDLQPHMLHRRAGEALAVNSVCRLHRVPGQSLGGLVRMIRDQAPAVVTVVEQEASHNGPHFLGRFLEALHYYSAVFDSLDATFPGDSVARAKVEQYVFAPVIKNIVACEGAERVERHERLERWRKVMEGKGFKGVPLSANAVSQSRILLGLYSCDGYRLTEDKGCLLLGWQDRPIIAASAWQC